MPTDLPTDVHTLIREALREGEIGAADLIHPELRQSRRRLPGFMAVAAAAVSVAALAVTVAIVTSGDGDGDGGTGRPPAASGGTFADVLGYQWKVAGLTDADGALDVPRPHGAMIGFTHHGYVVGNDSVNSIGGRYEATRGGYSVRDAATTLVAYGGDDPDRVRIIAAVDAMFFAVGTPGAQPPAAVVDVSLDGDALTLQQGEVTLKLERNGVQPEMSDMTEGTAASTATAAPTSAGPGVPPDQAKTS